MQIEHSPLKNEFISFWFETKVDGAHCYDTLLDFLRREWCTCKPDTNDALLSGTWAAGLPEAQIIAFVAPQVEAAIQAGRI